MRQTLKFAIYLLNRLAWLVPVVFVATLVMFVVARILPGNPAYLIVSAQAASPETIAKVIAEMGLDQPILVQYGRYMSGLLRGDLGVAWSTSNYVIDDLRVRLPATLELTLLALLVSVLISVPLGMLAALFQGRAIDHAARILSLIAVSIPSFWLGLMAMYVFAFQLRWLPFPTGRLPIGVSPPEPFTGLYTVDALVAGDFTTFGIALRQLILPVLTLALINAASLTRLVRTSMIEVLASPYILTARASGIKTWELFGKYALKNALKPTITMIGVIFGYLLGGSVVVEVIFSWPGMGRYGLSAIFLKDYGAVQGYVLLIAAVYILVFLIVDLLYFLVDPRIKVA